MMAGSNGHSMNGNGHHENGGSGGVPRRRNQDQSDIRQKVRAAVNGWLGARDLSWVEKTLHEIANDPEADRRARMNAAKALVDIAKLGQQVAEFDDKTGRLDSGDATERVETREVVVTVPRVGRLSE